MIFSVSLNTFQLAACLDPVEVKSGSAISMINASLIVRDNKYILEVGVHICCYPDIKLAYLCNILCF